MHSQNTERLMISLCSVPTFKQGTPVCTMMIRNRNPSLNACVAGFMSIFLHTSLSTSLQRTVPGCPLLPLFLFPLIPLPLFSPTDVSISDYSKSMQSAANFPASRYKLIEGNRCPSIQLARICPCPACLQHSWLLETSHSGIELLSPLLLPSW